jgi:hypothetical protein
MPYKYKEDKAAYMRLNQKNFPSRRNRENWPSSQKAVQREYEKKYEDTSRPTAWRSFPFIGCDGEGYNYCGHEEGCGQERTWGLGHEKTVEIIKYTNHVPGCQRYALFMTSEGEAIIDKEGLSTLECLTFVAKLSEMHPKSIHVIYGGSYDANMMLKDLDYKHLTWLQKNKRVRWRNFRIEYVPRKFFRVAEYDKDDRRPWKEQKPIRSTTLWDVIGFFQGPFVSAIKKYFPDEQEQLELELDAIIEGKSRRSQFTDEELESFVIPYTFREVNALVSLMERLRQCFVEADIRVKRWDGAGAVAAAFLMKSHVKQYYAELPKDVERAAQTAYSGGRIEQLQIGHTEAIEEFPDGWDHSFEEYPDGWVYHYDEIGAYPDKMGRLPILLGGQWIHDTSPDNLLPLSPYTMYKIYWDYKYAYDTDGTRRRRGKPLHLHPFFYRQPWNSPRVYYPSRGYSWVWEPELAVALKWNKFLRGKIVFFEKWQFVPASDYKPFHFVEGLYQRRLELKAQGKGAQHAFKLGVNSFYGKTAQTEGFRYRDDQLRKPPFYNLMYAGLITSYTRADMFDAAMQSPEDIIAIATDGVFSRVPLDLDLGKGLGQWEFEALRKFTSVQAGIWFAETASGEKIERYRGFNSGAITEDMVFQGWQDGKDNIPIKTQRFITLGNAIASEERVKNYWRVWDNTPRRLDIMPMSGKRIANYYPKDYHVACQTMLPLDVENPHWFDHKIHDVANLDETFLSKQHPLPWEMYEMTDKEVENEDFYRDQWDVIESDL